MIEDNKYMAVKFTGWFVDNPNDEVYKSQLDMLPNDDVVSKLYDIWLEKYFTPEIIVPNQTNYEDTPSNYDPEENVNSHTDGEWKEDYSDYYEAKKKERKEEGKDEGWVHRFNSEQEFLDCLKQGQEIERLKQWKAEAMAVMPDFQEIGKILGVKLGEDVSGKIIPELKRYSQEVTRLKGLIENWWHKAHNYMKTDLRESAWEQFAKENGLKGEGE